MHIRKVDWRINTLEPAVVGIEVGLATIEEKMAASEWYDGGHARDDAEPLLGLSFVAFQTYAVGTVSDLNLIRKTQGKTALSKLECYAEDSIKISGLATRLQIINSAANYFKHHDEWAQWPTGKQRGAQDAKTLGYFGIKQDTLHPCIKIIELLCGTSWNVVRIQKIVKGWRSHIFSKFC